MNGREVLGAVALLWEQAGRGGLDWCEHPIEVGHISEAVGGYRIHAEPTVADIVLLVAALRLVGVTEITTHRTET